MEEKDAHLEFIDSKEIKRLVDLIYSSNPEHIDIDMKKDVNPIDYDNIIQKIDGLQIKDEKLTPPKN